MGEHRRESDGARHCCVPSGCDGEDPTIREEDLCNAVRVLCNNEQCPVGRFMHKECFEAWEQSVLTYLRSTGRARSWSEKQRLQNLWTKKGYDLAFKACGCRCGKGHLRKDLDWTPPPEKQSQAPVDVKKKGRRKKANDKPALGTVPVTAAAAAAGTREGRPMLRMRSNSMSSTGSNSGSSPPSSGTGESPKSPTHQYHQHHHHLLTGSGCGGGGVILLTNGRRRPSKFEFFSDRLGNGSIFSRRLDYSSFNSLPRHKINSYHIKMEDDGNCGNDETRCFVLSNLAAARMSRVMCVLCQSIMLIFDQYPLIDGTFFLSPRQHRKSCLQVKVDGRLQYLGAVCMGCLEGWNTQLRCHFCLKRWQGTSLILGTMYSYDIFAANPCCLDRLKCNNCHKLVVLPEERFNYFSDYSNSLLCPHCGHVDYHFVKSLSTFARGEREFLNPEDCH